MTVSVEMMQKEMHEVFEIEQRKAMSSKSCLLVLMIVGGLVCLELVHATVAFLAQLASVSLDTRHVERRGLSLQKNDFRASLALSV